jgi:plastocyanin
LIGRRLLAVGSAAGAALLALALAAGPAAAASGVTISNFAYSPSSLTVPAGTTVTWTNQDAAPHSVTSDTGAFDSSPSNCSPTVATGCIPQSGGTFSFTFATAGTFAYHCRVHSFMHGTIVVTAVTTTTPVTTPTTVPATTPPTTAPGTSPTTAAPTTGSGSSPAVAGATATTTASSLAATGAADLDRLAGAAGVLALVGGLVIVGAARRRSG